MLPQQEDGGTFPCYLDEEFGTTKSSGSSARLSVHTDETPQDWSGAPAPGPECTSPPSVARCAHPVPSWIFSGASILDGFCQRWDPRSQCLEPGGNAFASLDECQKTCSNATHVNSRCGAVRSRACRDGDRRLQYVVGLGLAAAVADSTERVRCTRLPPDMCAFEGRGFASLAECRDACNIGKTAPTNDDSPASSSHPRCRPGAVVRRCSWEQRRLPFFYDQDEARCLPFMHLCLARGGFRDRDTCVQRCLLAPA
ncbi:uncharacterized protein [Dermacentor andersoni]|uniref:uncharacterized protein n=1 Tax=Dermacentor andersoni TaxID=34620 RepID=UPI003B3AB167